MNDDQEDCGDGSDEPVDNNGDWHYCDGEQIPFQWVNDGIANCDDGGDEYDADNPQYFYCDEYQTTISFALLNDGNFDCTDQSDEGYALYHLMDATLNDEQGGALVIAEDIMACAAWACEARINVDAGDIEYRSDVVAPAMDYGETVMCASATLSEADGTTLALEADNWCVRLLERTGNPHLRNAPSRRRRKPTPGFRVRRPLVQRVQRRGGQLARG